MEKIKKNFGFGMMRLPMVGEAVDFEQVNTMVDTFLARGFNYFDTATPYIGGQSQEAIQKCLASRHPRESFVLVNKLSDSLWEKEADLEPVLNRQLADCGVEYFDIYLMHAMNAQRHEFYMENGAYDFAQNMKKLGKLRHVGFSFHDTAQVLDKILTDRPELEVVQLQFNYADYLDPRVQGKACLEVCRKHGKPVIVMEPVKGGILASLPQEAEALLAGASPAELAIRYAAGFEGIRMVLSGMSNTAQLEENLSFMEDFKPLTEDEHKLVGKVRTLFQAQNRIPCTGCRYCVDDCPASIPIPDLFAWVNAQKNEEKPKESYFDILGASGFCMGCARCEKSCPQTLHIRKLLQEIDKIYSK